MIAEPFFQLFLSTVMFAAIDRRDVESYICAACSLELIMFERDVLHIPLDFCFLEIDVAVSSLCNA